MNKLCLCHNRFLQENRIACEIGLYYILHITKQRNKNAFLRLLPALGKFLSHLLFYGCLPCTGHPGGH